MILQTLIATGGMIVLVLLYAGFQLLAERMRALNGECRLNSLRCLGCLASGRCGRKNTDNKGPRQRVRPENRLPQNL